MSLRPSQLPLALERDPAGRPHAWRDGAALACLGRTLTLRLSDALAEPARVGDELHLPLPPQASERQIRDGCEAWLRAQAQALFAGLLAHRAAQAGRSAPPMRLSFARRGHWTASTDDGALQCNWRLIEQTPQVIEHVLTRALHVHWAALAARVGPTGDLFATA